MLNRPVFSALRRIVTHKLLHLLASMLALFVWSLSSAASQPVKVMTSFSILADLVQQVGGERVTVSSLVGSDEDAHGYQPRPSDARQLREADLVIANGLGFDSWLQRLAAAAGYRGSLIIAAQDITPLRNHAGHHHHDGDAHDHGEFDPHAWQDVHNVQHYVRTIAAALASADPEGQAYYAAREAKYLLELEALDRDLRAQLARLPAESRKVISSHDAFAYFTAAYGIEFHAAAGLNHDSEPSAAGIARLIRQIRREAIRAVFLENISDPRLMQRIGAESGAKIGGALYSDALSGPNGPAPDYLSLMRHNVRTLVEGLLPTGEQ